MGAGQSNDTTADEVITKTSYYELIGVSRQATEEEIKKTYRRKALELHPDRNFGNEEEATKTFAEVQAAYEILSDPQERAWYDSHEAAILRGDDGLDQDVHTYDNIRVTSADDLARVLRKFNSHVDFSDSPSGFYGFLREQFEHLAKEEEAAAAWDDVVAPDYPSFGHKDDRHDDVVKTFYSAWANFSTVKSFSWKDKYRLSEAPDRRIRRLMEKENNNIRQEAVREFNEAVRAFVLFVRKRDPRYTPSTQSETERQQVLRDAAAAQAARARAANQAKLEDEIPEWATYRDPDEIEESSEEEIVEEIFECVACDKTFKSERQFEAHERSKKHQKAIQALQRKMRKENANYDLDVAEADQPVLHDEDGYEVQDAVDDQYEAEMVAINSREDEIVKPEEAEQDATVNRQADEDDADAQSPTEDDSSSDIDAANRLKNIHLDASDDPTDDSTTKPRKIGKAAQKRAKKAAASMNASSGENQHKCAGCDATFSSRTRLFQHIKDHGHAAPKQLTSAKAKKGKR